MNVEKRERRMNYQFGNGYKMGRDEREVAKLKAKVDVSPIPEWVSEKIIDKMVKVCFNARKVQKNETFRQNWCHQTGLIQSKLMTIALADSKFPRSTLSPCSYGLLLPYHYCQTEQFVSAQSIIMTMNLFSRIHATDFQLTEESSSKCKDMLAIR